MSSQTTEFADVFGTVFRTNQRIFEEFPVVSLLAGARNEKEDVSTAPPYLAAARFTIAAASIPRGSAP